MKAVDKRMDHGIDKKTQCFSVVSKIIKIPFCFVSEQYSLKKRYYFDFWYIKFLNKQGPENEYIRVFW